MRYHLSRRLRLKSLAVLRSALLIVWFFFCIMTVHLIAAAGLALGGPVLAYAIYVFFVTVFIAGVMVAA
jgi:hypothetical protein